MTAAADLLATLRLRGVLRAQSYTATVPAADLTAGTLTPYAVHLMTDMRATPSEFLAVTRISTQGIKPSTVGILARDINRSAFTLQLTPDLVIEDVPLLGVGQEGVRLEYRNANGKAIEIVHHVAILSEEQIAEILGDIPRRGGA